LLPVFSGLLPSRETLRLRCGRFGLRFLGLDVIGDAVDFVPKRFKVFEQGFPEIVADFAAVCLRLRLRRLDQEIERLIDLEECRPAGQLRCGDYFCRTHAAIPPLRSTPSVPGLVSTFRSLPFRKPRNNCRSRDGTY